MIAAVLAMGAMFSWTAVAWTLESSGPSSVTDTVDRPAQIQNARLLEQWKRAQAALQDHHARVVEQGERVAQVGLDHQARMQRDLGARAPTETVPPMATVPPLVSDD